MRNIERISENLGAHYPQMQHFITQSVDLISADGYYGNDAGFARSIDKQGLLYMLDLHADQSIYLECQELEIPQRKSSKGREPKNLKPILKSISVKKYTDVLKKNNWKALTVRNTAKEKFKGNYHFAKVYIWNKNTIEPRLLVIRRTISNNNAVEIKYSLTNANMEQYTAESLANMQAQRFFVEHCIRNRSKFLDWMSFKHECGMH